MKGAPLRTPAALEREGGKGYIVVPAYGGSLAEARRVPVTKPKHPRVDRSGGTATTKWGHHYAHHQQWQGHHHADRQAPKISRPPLIGAPLRLPPTVARAPRRRQAGCGGLVAHTRVPLQLPPTVARAGQRIQAGT
eukprot:scaffold70606_cov18-Tisochrysis_lutea.AAC.1